MNQQRPVNLDLGSMKFPPMAIASILHRISGLVLFLLLPIMLYVLRGTLVSAESYGHIHELLKSNHLFKLVILGFSSAWIYHLAAGMRHLMMDAGFGESVIMGRLTAILVIGVGIVGVVFVGAALWSM